MDFPNLNDTVFPNSTNVDVWKYQNNFDYSRWQPNVTLRMVNVPWNPNYNDVVKFKDDESRNTWFDNLDGDSITLTSMIFIKSDGSVKVPVPFDVAGKYNYIYVINPIMPSFDHQLAYENAQKRIERKHYFIVNSVMLSPNTTMLEVQPDIWTNYINACEIPYLYLWRGHAPVAAIDTDTYLKNPIKNNEYLLTDDIAVSNGNNVAHSEFKPINAGTPYLCVASTIAPQYLINLGTNTFNSWTNPGYSNRDVRWGYQQNVTGFSWGSPSNVGEVKTDITSLENNTPSLSVYGFKLSQAISDLNSIKEKYPQFITAIKAAFILGDDIIKLGSMHTLGAVSYYEIVPKNSSFNLTFKKEMFGYPKQYERFAKLYTSRYAAVEISDNNNKFNVKIENTNGKLSADIFANIAYPLLNITTLFNGINGTGSNEYTWQGAKQTITYGDISDYFLKFNIPTYALYQNAVDEYNIRNIGLNISKRERAIAEYKNSVGAANELKEDTEDTQNTNVSNTSRRGNTNVTNTAATMSTHVANVGNIGDSQVANQGTANAASSAIRAHNKSAEYAIFVSGERKLAADTGSDADCSMAVAAAENNQTAVTASNNASAATQGGSWSAISGLAAGAGVAAAPVTGGASLALSGLASGIAGYQQSGITATQIQANSAIAISTNSDVASTVASAAASKANHAADNAQATHDAKQSAEDANTVTSNSANLAQVQNTASTNNTNAANDRTTNNANANRSANMENSNASATASTEKNNATQTRNERVEAAKRTLEAEQEALHREYIQARLSEPVQVGEFRGQDNGSEQASFHHMKMEGFQIRIKTPSASNLHQVGDYFARFGYNLEQVWEVKNLQVMKHFTYWRARDIWINDGTGTNGIAQLMISNIFKNGVTIWSKPEEIGRVSVYDN